MRRITALATVLALGFAAQAATAGGFAFDLPRVDFPTTTTVSTNGSLTTTTSETGN
ncbi:hypothetical protein [Vannielia litorea]|uniref:hypothetical protein n=1 Tax=Vannielia litorea TaxID=1217970 RepID=UPI001BD14D50|nr:hypothetical protein [Vannielia litorea]